MRTSLIPWHVFLDATKEQTPSAMETWLRRWLFTNDGVFMAHSKGALENSFTFMIPEAEEQTDKPRWGNLKPV